MPDTHIDALSKQLELSENAIYRAKQIELQSFEKWGEKDALGIAVAAIYIASILDGNRRTQKKICECAKTYPYKLYFWYTKMAEHLDL